MGNTVDVIPEIEKQASKPKELFRVLLLVLIIFTIAFCKMIVGVIDDFRHLPTVAYIAFAVIVSFPAIGLLVMAFRTKIGWIVNLILYFFMSALMIQGLVRGLIENSNVNYLEETERILILFLAVVSTILLLTGTIRLYLGIKNVHLFVTLAIAVLVSCVFVPMLK